MMGYSNRHGVRYTHLPTGLAAQCREERSIHKCDRAALAILRARLARHRELGGDGIDPMAGEVVREYDGVAVVAEDQRTLWREPFHGIDGLGGGGLERMLGTFIRQMAN